MIVFKNMCCLLLASYFLHITSSCLALKVSKYFHVLKDVCVECFELFWNLKAGDDDPDNEAVGRSRAKTRKFYAMKDTHTCMPKMQSY